MKKVQKNYFFTSFIDLDQRCKAWMMQIFDPDEGASKRRSCDKMPQQWRERQARCNVTESSNQVSWFKASKVSWFKISRKVKC